MFERTKARFGHAPAVDDWHVLLDRSDDVATTHELIAAGCGEASIRRHLIAGRWQKPLPGVVITHSGPPTPMQIRRAALLWAGRDSILSHRSAGELLGLRVSERTVDVTVPHGVRRRSNPVVTTHQSNRPTDPVYRGGLPCTPVARTVVDLACLLDRRDDVRALVADSVQRRLTSFAALEREADTAPRHSPGFLRSALDEVGAGARSAGEAEFLRLVRDAGLPEPRLNAKVVAGGRTYVVDAVWPECRVIVEIDGMAHHTGVAQWEGDLHRQNALHGRDMWSSVFPYGGCTPIRPAS